MSQLKLKHRCQAGKGKIGDWENALNKGTIAGNQGWWDVILKD